MNITWILLLYILILLIIMAFLYACYGRLCDLCRHDIVFILFSTTIIISFYIYELYNYIGIIYMFVCAGSLIIFLACLYEKIRNNILHGSDASGKRVNNILYKRAVIPLATIFLYIILFFILISVYPPVHVIINPQSISENISIDGAVIKTISIKNMGIELSDVTPESYIPNLVSPIYVNVIPTDSGENSKIKIDRINVCNIDVAISDPKGIDLSQSEVYAEIGYIKDTLWLIPENPPNSNLTEDGILIFKVTLDAKDLIPGEYQGYIKINATKSTILNDDEITVGIIPVVLNVAGPKGSQPAGATHNDSTINIRGNINITELLAKQKIV